MTDETLEIHFLDVGREKYGDCIFVRRGAMSALVDGGHLGNATADGVTPSIPDQLRQLTGQTEGVIRVNLLVVTHCHGDHIGCLPELITGGQLVAEVALVADELLGFGRDANGARSPEVETAPTPVKQVIAALHEEERKPSEVDGLAEFLLDAARLEDRYGAMLLHLQAAGSRLVRYGRDDHRSLETTFSVLGLKILGPTADQLVICAEQLQRAQQRAARVLTPLQESVTTDDLTHLYLEYLRLLPVLDGGGRQDGAAVNNQSMMLSFGEAHERLLLTGDMQLAAPGTAGLQKLMQELYIATLAHGPYAVVKTAHHTSRNGLTKEMAEALTRRYLVHTGGRGDPWHPSADVLEEFKRLRAGLIFARTDRNGLISITGDRLNVTRGKLGDFTPNHSQDARSQPTSPPPEEIHIHLHLQARMPVLHLHLHIDEQQGSPQETLPLSEGNVVERQIGAQEVVIAQGRILPRLAFVTDRQKLSDKLGTRLVDEVIEKLREEGHDVVLAAGREDAVAQLRHCQEAVGVVVLGGYEVLPAVRLRTLPPQLQANQELDVHADPDLFIVWSDDLYGDMDEDRLPERPVSRIPDGGDPATFLAALRGGQAPAAEKFGIRNSRRPFADSVWNQLPGNEQLLVSEPLESPQLPAAAVGGKITYFMLHGSSTDKTTFRGESAEHEIETFQVQNVPVAMGGVVFAGCCYGALISAQPAARHDAQVTDLVPHESLALSFLRAGAQAFVGCTGAHYSPVQGKKNFSWPLHEAFMTHLTVGRCAPALALFNARKDYLWGLPYLDVDSTEVQAAEFKTWAQFTCLGLGW